MISWSQKLIGVGNGGGGRGATRPRPPKFQVGGHRPRPPTLPTVYIMNLLQYCSIVDIVPHLCQLTGEGNHIYVV